MHYQFICAHCNLPFTRRKRQNPDGKPFRFCSNHCKNTAKKRPLAERFLARVDKNGPVPPHRPELGPCWIWTGNFRGGYGRIYKDGISQPAHRVSWELANGIELGEAFALHACDNKACVNPSHIHPGTPLENMQEMHERGRAVIVRGESLPHAKLTEELVRIIRRRARHGQTQRSLADEFGVSKSTIGRVVRRDDWQHVSDEEVAA